MSLIIPMLIIAVGFLAYAILRQSGAKRRIFLQKSRWQRLLDRFI